MEDDGECGRRLFVMSELPSAFHHVGVVTDGRSSFGRAARRQAAAATTTLLGAQARLSECACGDQMCSQSSGL